MKNQYEQHLNAAALQELGVPVIHNIKPESDDQIRQWIRSEKRVEIEYEYQVPELIERILADYTHRKSLHP